ncbi:MAG: hypothetical protein ACUVRG_03285 [Ignavibacterium sp.]|uniref:hypothetical protein n=1 Tax=Ignavibacterium sp. TaxID=2651167 RepID=UPI0040498D2A
MDYIDIAIKEITDVLNQLNESRSPILSSYTSNIKMVKLDEDNDDENKKVIE